MNASEAWYDAEEDLEPEHKGASSETTKEKNDGEH